MLSNLKGRNSLVSKTALWKSNSFNRRWRKRCTNDNGGRCRSGYSREGGKTGCTCVRLFFERVSKTKRAPALAWKKLLQKRSSHGLVRYSQRAYYFCDANLLLHFNRLLKNSSLQWIFAPRLLNSIHNVPCICAHFRSRCGPRDCSQISVTLQIFTERIRTY